MIPRGWQWNTASENCLNHEMVWIHQRCSDRACHFGWFVLVKRILPPFFLFLFIFSKLLATIWIWQFEIDLSILVYSCCLWFCSKPKGVRRALCQWNPPASLLEGTPAAGVDSFSVCPLLVNKLLSFQGPHQFSFLLIVWGQAYQATVITPREWYATHRMQFAWPL